jgi:quinoprotein glucose dehydrogenase
MRKGGHLAAFGLFLLVAGCGQKPIDGTSSMSGADWPHYHGNPNGTHYSTLDQITPQNVKNLKVAWEFDSGDAFGEGASQSEMEGNPMIIRGRLYFISPKGKLFCLDAATGKQVWVFDPSFGDDIITRQRLRGISYWEGDGKGRILFTFRGKLIAVDVATGRLINSFGKNGEVDLREGLGRDYDTISVGNVTPGVVYKDLIVMGSTGNTPGHIRAFDVRTGKMRWIFHTIPHPGEYGYETWPKDAWKTAKGANAWSGLTLDPERGLVFVPLASAGMGNKDFYGGDREGDNLFGTSLVALDANTGKRVWHFQLVKHDLWDRDPPTPPTLITIKGRPAVAQVTKAGLVFILDRETGKPLYPIKEIAVPATDVPGETTSPTQVVTISPERRSGRSLPVYDRVGLSIRLRCRGRSCCPAWTVALNMAAHPSIRKQACSISMPTRWRGHSRSSRNSRRWAGRAAKLSTRIIVLPATAMIAPVARRSFRR